MTEQLLSQQLESPSGTGRVEPRVRSAWQPPPSTNGIPTHRQTILTGKSVPILTGVRTDDSLRSARRGGASAGSGLARWSSGKARSRVVA